MMDSLFRRYPLILTLTALAVLLAVVIGAEFYFGGSSGTRAAPRRAASAETKLLPQLSAVAPEQEYAQMTARPLFTPTRRPAPAQVVVAQSAIQRGQFVLLGVIITNDLRIAMLREKSTGRIHRLEAGREVNGMKVAEIEPERVTMAQGAEQEVLVLSVQKPATPAGSAAAAAAAAAAPPPPQGTIGQGPFGLGGPPTPPPAAPAAQPQSAASVPPGGSPPAGPFSATAPAQGANPAARVDTSAPMSPEELLARRRARRLQQTQ
jgi:general secretion pathway protein N